MLCYLWGQIIEGHVASRLLVRTLPLEVFSPHISSLTVLRPPCGEEAQTLHVDSPHRETLRRNGEREKENGLASPQLLQLPPHLTTIGWETPGQNHPAKPSPNSWPTETKRENKQMVVSHQVLRDVTQQQMTRTEANFISFLPRVTIPPNLRGTVPVYTFCLA